MCLKDTVGGRFDATQAFVGEMSQFNIWDRVLKAEVVLLRSMPPLASVPLSKVLFTGVLILQASVNSPLSLISSTCDKTSYL